MRAFSSPRCARRGERESADPNVIARLRSLQYLRRRVVARIDRVLEELVISVGPELAHVRIGLHDRVDVLAALLLDLADVDVADHVAELVEADRAADRIQIG